jgi:Holliday junction resolvase
MKPYKSGYIIELKARDELRKMGFTVIRSSRSLTQADLVAINPNTKEIWLVQCKKEEAPRDLSRLQSRFKDLKQLEGTYICKPYVYIKKDNKYQFIEV